MVRVYLELRDNKWYEVEKSNFWIDRKLLEKLKAVKMIQKKGWDGVIIVDGKERSGKSVLAMLMGWYISNGHMTIKNFARGLEDAARKIAELPDRSVLIVDEASVVFSSKDSTTQAQKRLVKLLDVVGQKNLIFILCLPCIFDLNKTIAIRRSLFLCHIYPDSKYNRGRYAFWGEKKKKMLYMFGKRKFDSYQQPKAEFVGQYFDFEPHFYKEYLEIVKKESLKQVMDNAMKRKEDPKVVAMRIETLFYHYLKKVKNWTYKELIAIKNQPFSTIKDRINAYETVCEQIPKQK